MARDKGISDNKRTLRSNSSRDFKGSFDRGEEAVRCEGKPRKEERIKMEKKLSINSENFVLCRVGSFDRDYSITGKIGEGSFGTVYRVRHRDLGIERALKTIKKRGPEHYSSFEEIEVLRTMDHTNILKIYEFYQAADSYYLITQIFEGRELFNVILENDRMTEKDAADILSQVLKALNYSHHRKVAHRDLKPENILIRRTPAGKYRVKLIDWGLATLMGDKKAERICGTPEYVAPEVLNGSYTISCDMWSVGAIAFVMLTGDMPFEADGTEETMKIVRKGIPNMSGTGFRQLPQDAKQFITALLNRNPEKRMTAAKALEHPWLVRLSQRNCQPASLKETLQRLREFQFSSSLGTAVVSFINNHLSAQTDREKLQQTFRHLDTNNDGVLSLQQLTAGYVKLYGKELGQQIAAQTFEKLDINQNGSLQYSELVTFGLQEQKQQRQQKLREAFKLFDRDRNGSISKEEITLVLRGKITNTSDPEISQIIRQIDNNGNQQIDIEEFVQAIENVQPNNPQQPLSIQQIVQTPKKDNFQRNNTPVKMTPNRTPRAAEIGSARILRSRTISLG